MKHYTQLLIATTLLLLTLPTTALAQENTTQACINDNTLEINTSLNFTIDGNTSTLQSNERINCPYGCSDDTTSCKPPPFKENAFGFIIALSIIIPAMFFWYNASAGGLGVMFILSTFALLTGSMDVFGQTWRLVFWSLTFLTISGALLLLMKKDEWVEHDLDFDQDPMFDPDEDDGMFQ